MILYFQLKLKLFEEKEDGLLILLFLSQALGGGLTQDRSYMPFFFSLKSISDTQKGAVTNTVRNRTQPRLAAYPRRLPSLLRSDCSNDFDVYRFHRSLSFLLMYGFQ